MVENCCCTSQLYRPIQTRNESKNRTAQDTDLQLYSVGVAGFEPTASSSRTRVERDEQYQRVLSRARGSPHRVLW
jgi:hypothetical protein